MRGRGVWFALWALAGLVGCEGGNGPAYSPSAGGEAAKGTEPGKAAESAAPAKRGTSTGGAAPGKLQQ
jgi:hypothetical protein